MIILVSQLIVGDMPVQLPNIKRFLIGCFFVILYFCLCNFKNKKKIALNAFCTIVFFGIAISIIKPVQFGLDEEAHLKKTIRITTNPFFEKEKEKLEDYDRVFAFDALRNTEYKGISDWTKVEHGTNKAVGSVVKINNPSLFPAALGFKIGSIFSNKIYISYYLGRIFNVIAYAFLVFIALRISKYYKDAIYLFSTFPATIFICAGYHYDYLYFGISVILIALLTNFLNDENSVGIKEVITFTLASSLLVFSKFPYVLLGSFIVLLPTKQYKDFKVRLWGLFIFMIEMLFALFYYVNGTLLKIVNNVAPQVDSNQAQEIAKADIFYFMKHPLPVVRTVLKTLPETLRNFSQPFSYETYPSQFLEALTTVLLIFSIILISYHLNICFGWRQKLLFGGVLLVITLLVIYAISGDFRVYKIGDLIVGGVQGRYNFFILCMIPLFFNKPIQNLFDNYSSSDISRTKLTYFIQIMIAYLNVLSLGVALYTLIPR